MSRSRPRILVLDEEVPWPPTTGKRLRTLNLLTILAREFSIDLLVHSNNATEEALREMDRRGLTMRVAPSRIPPKNGYLLPLRVLRSAVAGLPYSVYSHYRAGFRKTLRRLLETEKYDLIHCEWTPYARYPLPEGLPVCIAAHNVEWAIWQRMAAAEARPVHRLVFDLQTRLMERFERGVFTKYQYATAVSTGDADIVHRLGCQHVAVVANGVDVEAYVPPPEETAEPRSLVFTGALDWRPNQDAIGWFIREVHPLLRARTDYRLYVVGRMPPPWLSDPASLPPEVVVTGTVDDVRPWIARAAVYVVPLRIGGGSRLKILEALAMGRAVVSTRVGAEGLELEPGRHLVIADSAEDFASAICRLLASKAERTALGQEGRARVEALYRWDQIALLQASLWRLAIGTVR